MNDHVLVLPLTVFHQVLRDLVSHPHAVRYLTVGQRALPSAQEWLAQRLFWQPPTQEPFFVLQLRPRDPASTEPGPSQCGWLWFERGAHIRLWGQARGAAAWEPLLRLVLVGAGMREVTVLDGRTVRG